MGTAGSVTTFATDIDSIHRPAAVEESAGQSVAGRVAPLARGIDMRANVLQRFPGVGMGRLAPNGCVLLVTLGTDLAADVRRRVAARAVTDVGRSAALVRGAAAPEHESREQETRGQNDGQDRGGFFFFFSAQREVDVCRPD